MVCGVPEFPVIAFWNMVTPTGFEPSVTAVKGQCLRPLDYGAINGGHDGI